MTKPFPFADNYFDLIINPVSTCFVEDVEPVFREAFRVLKPGGIFIAGLDNGMNYLVDEKEERIIHGLPYNPLNDPELYAWSTKQGDGVQFSHTAEEQLGLQLRVGFQLTHIDEIRMVKEGSMKWASSFYRSRHQATNLTLLISLTLVILVICNVRYAICITCVVCLVRRRYITTNAPKP